MLSIVILLFYVVGVWSLLSGTDRGFEIFIRAFLWGAALSCCTLIYVAVVIYKYGLCVAYSLDLLAAIFMLYSVLTLREG